MSLFSEYTREAQSIAIDYTVDALVIADDDLAYVVGYDAADSSYVILEGRRDEEGNVCFTPMRGAFDFASAALEVIAKAVEGYPLEVAVKIV